MLIYNEYKRHRGANETAQEVIGNEPGLKVQTALNKGIDAY